MGDQASATSRLRMPRIPQADHPTVLTEPAMGASASIAAHGEFDLHTAHLLASAIATAVERGARHLVLDLRHATFLDCSTLHALISAAEPLRDEPAANVVLTGAQGVVKRFFDLVGVDSLVPLARPRDDAIAALRALPSGQQTNAIAT